MHCSTTCLAYECFCIEHGPSCTLQGVIAVEGLDLRSVEPGSYYQICLPAKYGGSDGAPVRCVLMPQNWPQCKSSTHSEL